MEDEVVQYETKLRKLLDQFLEPNFQIKNDNYFNNLLSHLSGKENPELASALTDRPLFSEWIGDAISNWENTRVQPSHLIGTFSLYLISYLSKRETLFATLNTNNYYMRLFTVLNVRSTEANPSIKLAYIKVLSSFLDHRPGIDWIMGTEYWQDVLGFCLSSPTIYIARDSYNFMYNMLSRSVMYNHVFCNLVIEKIIFPLNSYIQNSVVIADTDDESLQKRLTPTLRLITYILESCLASDAFVKRDYHIPTFFLKNYHLEQSVWNVLMTARNEEFIFDLNKVMFLIYFFTLAIDSQSQVLECANLRTTGINILKILNMNIAKGGIPNVLKLGHLAHYYWKLISPRYPVLPDEGDNILFENQLIILQVMPCFIIPYKHCEFNILNLQDDEFREQFITKLFKILCESTIRMCYNWRHVLMAQSNEFENAERAIMYIMKSKQYYHRDRAVTVFQAFMYNLKDITQVIKNKPERIQIFSKQIGFMYALLDAITSLITDFDITWRESVETICVMSCTMEFLSSPNWPVKLVIGALKLVNLSIARFMSPNLALLVDRTNDSTMVLLGPMLAGKLHNMVWEVRDSALEVLHTISGIAHTKFPSFQKLILEYDLLTLVIKMSLADGESYVRASAIKCLQQMIKTSTFWVEILREEDLPHKLLRVMREETEAVVRCEAATLICDIYEHQSFSKEIMEKVYDTMVYGVTADLHWEVKLNSLNFWEKVINNRLANQGMIDGTFPNVTFSKEHRKIVTLTEREIKTRLNKVLVELSKCGCLSVLMIAIQDDCDLQVSKKAIEITKKLLQLLNRYNIAGVSTTVKELPQAVWDTFHLVNSNAQQSSKRVMSDDVIDQIVNTKDITLLGDFVNKESGTMVNSSGLQIKVEVAPETFLNFVQTDLDALVDERIKWLNGIDDLGSLLDDMLKSYDVNDDVNSMDCY